MADPSGDAGLEAPRYADLLRATIEDDGERARITVAFAAPLPTPPESGEVLGVGVDVYARASEESDYQLFAVGNADGWEPFLHSGGEVFEYPGEFRVEGSRIVFVLDWMFLGRLPRGAFRAFVDWSRERSPLNEAGGDRVPDRGTVSYRR